MPAKSEKQARYFRLVRAVQKGDVSPKKVSANLRKTARHISTKAARDFTKVKEIVNRLKEAEYSVSKMREVDGKSFDQLLNENTGVPFDKQELLTFQNKQNGFGGFGKVNFVHKKSSNELSAEVFSNETTKTYVFKKFKNNQNEYMLAHLYLEAAIKRGGYFCENYHYSNCGRPYQSNYGFQNMKKNVRNLVFKDHYIIDINSSFYRMAYELYSEEWNEELKDKIYQMLNNKNEYFSRYVEKEEDYQDFKVSLISCLLGTTDVYFIYMNKETEKIYKLLNSWRSPAKRRLIANDLFSKEQHYIKKQIEKMNMIPYVLIHDALIVKDEIKDLDKNMWSIKRV